MNSSGAFCNSLNIEKAFNTLHDNVKIGHDYPTERLMQAPIKSGRFVGALIDKAEWENMLDEYYVYYGWEINTGRQKISKLERVGLKTIADGLEKKEKTMP